MLALTLVRLIETHSEELTESLVEKLHRSQRTSFFHKLPKTVLKSRVEGVYRHLGDWLLAKTESDIEVRYTQLGEERARQGMPLSELFWAFIIGKENMLNFLHAHVFAERAIDLYGELEFLQALNQFFDHAIYYATVGHERASRPQKRVA